MVAICGTAHLKLFPMINVLYFHISTVRSMCAVPNMNDFVTVLVAPIITNITSVSTFHLRCVSIVRSLYFAMFSASYLTIFCLLIMQNLLTYMFFFRYHGL